MGFLDFLFPKTCLECGREGNYFCSSCRASVEPLKFQFCPVCQQKAFQGLTHPGCQTRYTPDGLFSFFPYQGLVREAILKLKYRLVADLAEELVDLATANEQRFFFDDSKGLTLIPIPLYWYRRNWRGFNQAKILGKRLAQKWKIDFSPSLLVRRRATRPQTELKGKEAERKRRENVRGAFRVNPKYSPNILVSQYPDILLFDDVWTTGATMREAARVLKKAGVKKVFGLTLARSGAR